MRWSPSKPTRQLRASRRARHRALEQARASAVLKAPKNGKTRTTIFPKSLADELGDLVEETIERNGAEGLLFLSSSGQIVSRSNFQPI